MHAKKCHKVENARAMSGQKGGGGRPIGRRPGVDRRGMEIRRETTF